MWYIKYTFLLVKGKAPVIHSGQHFLQSLVMFSSVRTIVGTIDDDVIWSVCRSTAICQHLLNDLLIFLRSRGDSEHQSLSNNILFYVANRLYATWLLAELDSMVAPLEIRFAEDVAFSRVFNYFCIINCGNRMSLTNDCFVAPPTTFLYFALKHNWYDASSVVITRLDQSHLQLNRWSSAKCLTWEHFMHVFSCRLLDIFGKMNLSAKSVTLTTCLCTGISTVLPGQAVKDSIDWPNG